MTVDLAYDAAHVWHPYSSFAGSHSIFPVREVCGNEIILDDGRRLIDGMASWWSAIHGYRHPALVEAMKAQLDTLPHVMFGGLTHAGAVELAKKLLARAPTTLSNVFYSDSGSVAVEVAIKMAIQYWAVRGSGSKTKIAALRGGYHGDTFGAMSICDPVTGMHQLFRGAMPEQVFLSRPTARFGSCADQQQLSDWRAMLANHADELAAVIVEPIVQGAGGMWFYSAEYLHELRALCDEFDLLLIFDEIATCCGRTGSFFAADAAGVTPDILCLGKALTGGTVSLAATLANEAIAETLSTHPPHALMHGPTYMANALACAAALANLRLFDDEGWRDDVSRLEAGLRLGLSPANALPNVRDVRVLGGIGVIELTEPVNMSKTPRLFVERGVWVRPFMNLIYVMPPYTLSPRELTTLCDAMCDVAEIIANET